MRMRRANSGAPRAVNVAAERKRSRTSWPANALAENGGRQARDDQEPEAVAQVFDAKLFEGIPATRQHSAGHGPIEPRRLRKAGFIGRVEQHRAVRNQGKSFAHDALVGRAGEGDVGADQRPCLARRHDGIAADDDRNRRSVDLVVPDGASDLIGQRQGFAFLGHQQPTGGRIHLRRDAGKHERRGNRQEDGGRCTQCRDEEPAVQLEPQTEPSHVRRRRLLT